MKQLFVFAVILLSMSLDTFCQEAGRSNDIFSIAEQVLEEGNLLFEVDNNSTFVYKLGGDVECNGHVNKQTYYVVVTLKGVDIIGLEDRSLYFIDSCDNPECDIIHLKRIVRFKVIEPEQIIEATH